MRIAVYGDSFAIAHPEYKELAWYNMIQEILPGCSVTSYGKGASSVYHSYKKFLETQHLYDKVIFLVTEPNRYTKGYVDVDNIEHHFQSLAGVEDFIRSNESTVDKNFLQNLRGWFMVNDDQFTEDMTELMIKEINNINPNTIIFPCFPNSMKQERMREHNDISMFNIFKMQCNKLNINCNIYTTHRDNEKLLFCHFTVELNRAIANVFARRITTGIWDWSEIYNITILNNLDYYIKRT